MAPRPPVTIYPPEDGSTFPVTAFTNVKSTHVTGQVVIAITGTAVPLPDNALVNGLVVKSLSTNNAAGGTVGGASVTNTVDGTGNGYVLEPGDAWSGAVSNSNLVYVNGTAGDIFTYTGS